MITMTYKHVTMMDFNRAMQKLTTTPMPGKMVKKVRQIADCLMGQRDIIAKEYTAKCVEPFAKRNEDGTIFRPDGQGKDGFEIAEENHEAFAKAQEEFGNTPFTINLGKLDLDQINVQFSVVETVALEPLCVTDAEKEAASEAKVLPISG